MSKRLALFVLLAVVLVPVVHSQGTVMDDSFWCERITNFCMVDVYVPEGYDENDTETLYPVIYYLHGGRANENSDPALIDTLDAMIGRGAIDPVIVVKPNGNIIRYAGASWWSDSEVNGDYECYAAIDVIDYIESNYNVDTSPEKRAIMGFSMGGFGCMQIALDYPDQFAAVASHTGILDLEGALNIALPGMLAEAGGSGPFSPSDGGWSNMIFACSAAWSPNPDATPEPVDLPVDDDGTILPAVLERWAEHDASEKIKTFQAGEYPPIYMDCGTSDTWYAVSESFYDTTVAYGLPVKYLSYPGNHGSLYTRFPYSLAFIDSVFHPVVDDVRSGGAIQPAEYSIGAFYPNPFNAMGSVSITLPANGGLRVDVFDMLGRRVDVLAQGDYARGEHRISLQGNDLTSGVYFVRTTFEGVSTTQKVQLIK